MKNPEFLHILFSPVLPNPNGGFMAVLMASQITSAHAGAALTSVCTSNQISNGTCRYYDISSSAWSRALSITTGYSGQDCFNLGKTSSTTSDRWDVAGWCVANDTGHDGYVYADKYCSDNGYNVFVYDYSSSANTVKWACACARDTSFVEWRTYSTSVLRKYSPTLGANCAITATATSEYKCAPGYYGPGNSASGCKVCPSNATCDGRTISSGNTTTFVCNYGYYKNSTNTGCIKCPDSKEGGLGWDANGNGVAAGNGIDDIELCEIMDGTVLYDNTGKFIMDNGDNSDGCTYTK